MVYIYYTTLLYLLISVCVTQAMDEAMQMGRESADVESSPEMVVITTAEGQTGMVAAKQVTTLVHGDGNANVLSVEELDISIHGSGTEIFVHGAGHSPVEAFDAMPYEQESPEHLPFNTESLLEAETHLKLLQNGDEEQIKRAFATLYRERCPILYTLLQHQNQKVDKPRKHHGRHSSKHRGRHSNMHGHNGEDDDNAFHGAIIEQGENSDSDSRGRRDSGSTSVDVATPPLSPQSPRFPSSPQSPRPSRKASGKSGRSSGVVAPYSPRKLVWTSVDIGMQSSSQSIDTQELLQLQQSELLIALLEKINQENRQKAMKSEATVKLRDKEAEDAAKKAEKEAGRRKLLNTATGLLVTGIIAWVGACQGDKTK